MTTIPTDDVALSLVRHALGGRLTVVDGEHRLVGADMSLPRLLDFWAGHDPEVGEWDGDVWVCHHPTFSQADLILALVEEIESLRARATATR